MEKTGNIDESVTPNPTKDAQRTRHEEAVASEEVIPYQVPWSDKMPVLPVRPYDTDLTKAAADRVANRPRD